MASSSEPIRVNTALPPAGLETDCGHCRISGGAEERQRRSRGGAEEKAFLSLSPEGDNSLKETRLWWGTAHTYTPECCRETSEIIRLPVPRTWIPSTPMERPSSGHRGGNTTQTMLTILIRYYRLIK
ncbi:hypothetical protein EYF80_035350 [Liparis tanakae]|uniref:Uncharacterized protein n=1 Tax=Liparis tanakae TaxID=230148 RepID=A0A4Z2GMJ0_9TELE|nr:hypothetical protein EYF80_035350 [Liparis tanakae]